MTTRAFLEIPSLVHEASEEREECPPRHQRGVAMVRLVAMVIYVVAMLAGVVVKTTLGITPIAG
ncbi:MAG: hypothetical protein COZ49_03690 [Candidatus Yonathbacteria bacterium CG_4_10_14_3_um_filter_47_65]|uniref:Uncharacterized protein n=2 Tax=Parcubacteria group TaxID=1794811 RepID=A0A2M8D7S9_9BACT|nr:MAG: hypothetical protein AUJ44_00495 [Candidatus Nomurabacteria bacterium CG1_02_47_685]PIP04252.1 MAG: hypothetical protein COX54_00190 [Candidatus Yonathbacteria bacterium CG23_combo_of_CG06-09_8_20_14_all_46_18]PIQ31953.1 MAG: hypothetical protein COW61_02855 [Candidatus Yonathbacteria bacterium CG17_big_fil_post_rev_8_21_14_2_50_46_19]PIX56161.1 MAG: hypothetical protein COZ49_03690 [Candidatus Yonathbacteria bacterium CG_4_10_14_3_um_filter_47_65]PIY58005.1 MAG: hypothetical protein CO